MVINMFKVAICDDQIMICSELEGMLNEYAASICENFEVEQYFTGRKLCDDLQKGIFFDLLILDIEMPEPNGVSIGQFIRKELKNYDVGIVYISSHSSYAMELFQNRPFDFLIKPLKKEQIKKVIGEFIENARKKFRVFQYAKKNKVFIKDILYFTIRGRVVEMVTVEGMQTFYGRLSDIYAQLGAQQFFYVNKSQIVNYNRVKEFYYDKLIMEDAEEIIISQGKRKQVLELQKEYFAREMRV